MRGIQAAQGPGAGVHLSGRVPAELAAAAAAQPVTLLWLPAFLPRSAGLKVSCSKWKAGTSSACPTSCTLAPAGSRTTPVTVDLTGCDACTDGETGFTLTCYRCKPGFVHVYYSFDHQVSAACMHASALRC